MDSSQRALQTNGKLISNSFLNYRRKPENIQTNSEARILLKFHCVIYQWIRLDKLYKLMQSFLKFFSNNDFVGFMPARWGVIFADQPAFYF